MIKNDTFFYQVDGSLASIHLFMGNDTSLFGGTEWIYEMIHLYNSSYPSDDYKIKIEAFFDFKWTDVQVITAVCELEKL